MLVVGKPCRRRPVDCLKKLHPRPNVSPFDTLLLHHLLLQQIKTRRATVSTRYTEDGISHSGIYDRRTTDATTQSPESPACAPQQPPPSMTSTPDVQSDGEASPITNPKRRPAQRLPYSRSNVSLSNLFASTTSRPSYPPPHSQSEETIASPGPAANGSVFSPTGSTIRSPSPVLSARLSGGGQETRDVILRAFSPHVSVLASQDTEELVRHKGVHGGLLELLRPFGERVPGKVTIRDSAGASRSWDDFAVRFIGVKDGLENPRTTTTVNRNSVDSNTSRNGAQRSSILQEYKPARLRSGGDVPQIEELIERHLTFSEEQSGPFAADYINHKDATTTNSSDGASPFYLLYLRRLLSGLPMVPSETFSHPVASVIAISSRSPSPIEDLRTLYASSNTGENRLPQWVHNEFLRYYVLVHDEDYDDINTSTHLYEQMKRHFGLHCHLLRLRSTTCISSDDEAYKLPLSEWTAAAEELAEITRREASEDDDDDSATTPCIYETDAANLRAFVREMVTQSIIPSMERASANWNDQVASRRRGISGRFMSLSKRWTAFGSGSSSRNSASSISSALGGLAGGGSNYDSLQGFYRPDAAEAVMRRLADYAVMLRDFKLALGVYEILAQDFKADKAWRHFAGANEMGAVCSLIVAGGPGSNSLAGGKAVAEQFIEAAYYSYVTRVGAPYYALRTLVLAVELLKLRGAGEEAAKWAERLLEDRLVGPVGWVLVMERLAACYTATTAEAQREKRRKAGFWNLLACDAWLRLDKGRRAEACLNEAVKLYGLVEGQVQFEGMAAFLQKLQIAVKRNRAGPMHFDGPADMLVGDEVVETLQDDNERLARRPSLGGAGVTPIAPMHRKSSSLTAPQLPLLRTSFEDPLGAASAYGDATPRTGMQRHRAPSNASIAGLGVGTLSPHVEEGSPLQPMSAVLEGRRRDDGFEEQ